jgi:GAF domain-containing protein
LAEAEQPAQPGADSGAVDLTAMTEALGHARGEQAVLSAFTGQLAAVLPFDLCAITLAAPDTSDYVIAHAAGARADLIQGRRVVAGEGVTGWALTNCLPFGNTDPKLDFPPGEGERFADLRTLAVCPVKQGEKLLGAVTVYSASLAQYDVGHQQLMEKSAALLATALLSQAAAPPAFRPVMAEAAEVKAAV